jgi:hypothetical protein
MFDADASRKADSGPPPRKVFIGRLSGKTDMSNIMPIFNRKSTAKPSSRRGFLGALAAIVLAAALSGVPNALADEEPSPEQILQAIRYSQTLQNQTLSGRLRTGSTRYPFLLRLDGPRIAYTFRDTGETIKLVLSPQGSQVRGQTAESLSPDELSRPVRGTPLTYEDISLQFLYWPHAEIVDKERIMNFMAYKMWVAAPADQSNYGGVFLWVPTAGPGLLRAEMYDRQHNLIKRFTVREAQKIDGQWTLKNMRIEKFEPGTENVVARTYLEIDGVAGE